MNINLQSLKAVSHLAAKKDTRYYLVGVLVEYTEWQTILVATNGHALAARRMETDNTGSGSFIIPLDTVDTILRIKTKDSSFTIDVGDDGKCTASLAGQSVLFAPVEGKFPDWRKVIPRGPFSGHAAQFQPQYLMSFQKAAEALARKGTSLANAYNGNAAALVEVNGDQDFVGVIMPYKADTPMSSPSWSH